MKGCHAAERHTASMVSEILRQNCAVLLSRATCAEKTCPLLQECMKKVMFENDWLTARCKELSSESLCVSGGANEIKKGPEFCLLV